MKPNPLIIVTLGLVLGAAPLASQRVAPTNWRWTLDSAARYDTLTDEIPRGTFGFVAMAPGWHITMGPGALLYDATHQADGRFTLQSRLFLFPGTPAAEYGVFFGGSELEGGNATWTAFVVRRDQSAAVVRRHQGRIETLVPWTSHAAIRGGSEGGANVLRVHVDSVITFQVNDSTIATLPRDRVATSGRFGFRVGPDLNLHVTTLDLTRRFAPAR
jgi:hypothetical protein